MAEKNNVPIYVDPLIMDAAKGIKRKVIITPRGIFSRLFWRFIKYDAEIKEVNCNSLCDLLPKRKITSTRE